MNDETAQQILAELISIRQLLEQERKMIKPVTANTTRPGIDEIPQPSELVQHPEHVCVHFGKNKDVPLGELSLRSVEWYAKEPEPKLDRNGKPFPPRDADLRLRNAARQMIHKARGTLAGNTTAPIATAAVLAAQTLNGDEEVPF
jgi:hypothetical protein